MNLDALLALEKNFQDFSNRVQARQTEAKEELRDARERYRVLRGQYEHLVMADSRDEAATMRTKLDQAKDTLTFCEEQAQLLDKIKPGAFYKQFPDPAHHQAALDLQAGAVKFLTEQGEALQDRVQECLDLIARYTKSVESVHDQIRLANQGYRALNVARAALPEEDRVRPPHLQQPGRELDVSMRDVTLEVGPMPSLSYPKNPERTPEEVQAALETLRG